MIRTPWGGVMERGSTKHGPLHDEELAHETEGMVRGQPQRAHAEEWRESESDDGALPPHRHAKGSNPRPTGRDLELRSELARVARRDWFPISREALLERLASADAPQDLADRVASLPRGARYSSSHDVLAALGINSPETR